MSVDSIEEPCILVQDTTENLGEYQSASVRQVGVVDASTGNPDEWQVWSPSKYTHQELRDCQVKDDDLKKLIICREEKCEPSQKELQLSSPAVKFFWCNLSLLEIHQGVLFYKWIEDHSRRYLFMVPATMRNEVLHCCHDIKSAGHPGISRTYFKLHQSAMWFGMKTDCIVYVKSCRQCNRQKKASRRCRAS